MAIIPTKYMNAVFSIGFHQYDGSLSWTGTGFMVMRPIKHDSEKQSYYMITNKHIVWNQKQLVVRFNALSGDFVNDYIVELIDSNGNPTYSSHPNSTTDIVAIHIDPDTLFSEGTVWDSFDLQKNALSLEEMRQTGVDEGSLIYALGFPLGMVEIIKTPICRLGCISRVFDSFLKRETECPTFLVDAQAFPGNSGGPIVNRPESFSIVNTPANNTSNLIGIVSAYIPYKEALTSLQTGNIRMVQEENTGLTVVHPVDRIREVVDIEWNRINAAQAANNY